MNLTMDQKLKLEKLKAEKLMKIYKNKATQFESDVSKIEHIMMKKRNRELLRIKYLDQKEIDLVL